MNTLYLLLTYWSRKRRVWAIVRDWADSHAQDSYEAASNFMIAEWIIYGAIWEKFRFQKFSRQDVWDALDARFSNWL